MEIRKYSELLLKPVPILPLVVFRVIFGVLMTVASIRFWAKGWIEELYLKPGFHFHFQGFGWVNVPGETLVYSLFLLKIILAAFIAAGLFYRVSTVLFFLIFTYIELFDKALYLNHNYLVCLLAFYLIFVPAHKLHSIDSRLGICETKREVKNIYLLVIKVQLVLVYFFAGLAKLNSDWLISAQPLNIWLKAKTELPLIGALFEHDSTAVIMSWGGMIFDLTVPFLLFSKKTLKWAYPILAVFHLLTAVLFPIGMFPWIMIFCTLIFFDFEKHSEKVSDSKPEKSLKLCTAHIILMVMIIIQFCLPFRHLLYRGDSTWYEVGCRFSWKVMKVEKTGSIDFICYDPAENKKWVVSPGDILTPIQEMQMSYQPDMIQEFAKYLRESSRREIEVYADSWVSMNGRLPQRYVKENIDLAEVSGHNPESWIHNLIKE